MFPTFGIHTLRDLDDVLAFVKWKRRGMIRAFWSISVFEQSEAQLNRPRVPPATADSSGKRGRSKESEVMLLLKDSQGANLKVQFESKRHNPAFAESVKWTSSDDTVVTVTQDGTDPLAAQVLATGKIGTAQVNASGDPIEGEEVGDISAVLDVEVQAGAAVSATISSGEVFEQEEPPPPVEGGGRSAGRGSKR